MYGSLVWPPIHEANFEANARFSGLRGMHIHNLNHSNTARGPQLRGHAARPSPAACQADRQLSRLPPGPPGPPGRAASPEQSPPSHAPVRRRHHSPCHRPPRAFFNNPDADALHSGQSRAESGTNRCTLSRNLLQHQEMGPQRCSPPPIERRQGPQLAPTLRPRPLTTQSRCTREGHAGSRACTYPLCLSGPWRPPVVAASSRILHCRFAKPPQSPWAVARNPTCSAKQRARSASTIVIIAQPSSDVSSR